MRILWLSRHEPQKNQLDELRKKLGKFELIQKSLTIKDAKQVKEVMEQEGCDEVVAVLPINLLQDLIKLGIRPIRAVMEREFQGGKSVKFTHSHFERVEQIEIKTTPIL